MKESSPFLNILVPLWANRARTILYFIRYQEGSTWNERGSYSGTELLFLRIYPLFSPPPSPLPILLCLFLTSLFLLYLHAISSCANQPTACSLSSHEPPRRWGCRNLRSCFISAERRYVTVPLMSDLFKNGCATHRSLDRPR